MAVEKFRPDSLLPHLKQAWEKFLEAENEEQKVHWLYQFAFYFENTQKDINICLQSFSAVPSQLSCYLLELVHRIICKANRFSLQQCISFPGLISSHEYINSTNETIKIDTEHKESPKNKLLAENLKISNDLSTILSLREFLTSGLGRSILECLNKCSLEFIACKRELTDFILCVFPNSPWDNLGAKKFNLREKVSSNIIEEIIAEFEVLKTSSIYKKSNSSFLKTKNICTNFHEINLIEKSEEIEQFVSKKISSDEVASILINLLSKLIRNEYGKNLSDKSVTLMCLEFSLNSLNSSQNFVNFTPQNAVFLKLKLLMVVVKCLNNIFLCESNLQNIDLKNIFKKLICGIFQRTDATNEKKYKYQIAFNLTIIYIIFAFLNNSIYFAKRKILVGLEIINEIETNDLIILTNTLNNILKNGFTKVWPREICKVVKLLLQVLNDMKLIINHKNSFKKSKKLYKASNQAHCLMKGQQCALQNILFEIFLHSEIEIQEIIAKYLNKESTCCCLYDIKKLEVLIYNTYTVNVQRLVYNFIQTRFLKTIFGGSKCIRCKFKQESDTFHKDLFIIYKNKSKLDNSRCDIIFLRHLQKITYYVTLDISSQIMLDIVLPLLTSEVAKHRTTWNIQRILCYLYILIDYLQDARLMEIFYIEKNIKILEELMFIPDFVYCVGKLLKNGLNHFLYLSDSSSKQIVITERLYDLQVKATRSAMQLLKTNLSILSATSIDTFSLGILESKEFPWKNDSFKKIEECLYLVASQLSIILNLIKINSNFKNAFFKNKSLFFEDENSKEDYDSKTTFLILALDVIKCYLRNIYTCNIKTHNFFESQHHLNSSSHKIYHFNILSGYTKIQKANCNLSALDVFAYHELLNAHMTVNSSNNCYSFLEERNILSDCNALHNEPFPAVECLIEKDSKKSDILKIIEKNNPVIFDIKNQRNVNIVNNFFTKNITYNKRQYCDIYNNIFALNNEKTNILNFEDSFKNPNNSKCMECKKYFLYIFENLVAIILIYGDFTKLIDKNMDSLLQKIKSLLLKQSLNECNETESAQDITQALQSLLNVAEVTASSEYSENHIEVVKNVKTEEDADIISFDDIKNFRTSSISSLLNSDCNLSESDSEDPYLVTDDGYEADGEFQENCENYNEINKLLTPLTPSSSYRTNVMHAGLCKIVVEILMDLSKKCVKNPEIWCNNLSQVAHRLFSIRDNLGGSLFLIKGFAPILKSSNENLKDIQQSILNLITDLNKPDTLMAYLAILAANNPPIELLIRHMGQICRNKLKVQPSAEIVFPLISSLGQINDSDPSYDDFAKIKATQEFYNLQTPITMSPCVANINGLNIWTKDGFTISTWIQVELQSDRDTSLVKSKLHLISIGSDNLIISIYILPNLTFEFKLNKPNQEIKQKKMLNQRLNIKKTESQEITENPNNFRKNKLTNSGVNNENLNENVNDERNNSSLANAINSTRSAILNSISQFNIFSGATATNDTFELLTVCSRQIRLQPMKWTHICFSVYFESKNITINLLADGSDDEKITIPCQNAIQLTKTSSFEMVSFGSSVHSKENKLNIFFKYGISNLLLFRKCFLNNSLLSVLTALGPDLNTISNFQADYYAPNFGLNNLKRPNYNPPATPEIIINLKINLVFVYSAHYPKQVTIFKSNDETTIYGTRTSLLFHMENLKCSYIYSIQSSTYLCGGLSILLYLFARTVELTKNSDIQSLALDLLFKIGHIHSDLYMEFIRKDYLTLICSVIKTDKCAKDVNLLKSFVNNACSSNIILKRNNNIQLMLNTNACIVHPILITHIIKKFSDWNTPTTEESYVLDILLKCILILIREKHPCQSFNIKQLSEAGFLKDLLNLCRIHVVESLNPVFISSNSAEYFISILNIFAGAPPSPSLLDEIMKLLLVLHKPSDCFITHDRVKFYFLISVDTPAKFKLYNLPLTSRQTKNVLRERKRSTQYERSQSSFRKSSVKKKINFEDKQLLTTINQFQTKTMFPVLLNIQSLESVTDCTRINNKIQYFNQKRLAKLNTSLLHLKRQYEEHALNKKNHFKKIIRKKYNDLKIYCRGTRHLDVLIGHKSNLSNSGETDSSSTKEYDIVNSDEVFSTEQATQSKKNIKGVFKSELSYSLGITKIQEGLFSLLKDFLLILPDNLINEVVSHYIKLEIILVLANHRSAEVRASIVRLISVLCGRLTIADINNYTKKFIWHNLANQLALHGANENLVDACLNWITGSNLDINEVQSYSNIKTCSKIGINSLIGILPQTLWNNELSLKTTRAIKTIFICDHANSIYMVENGLIQCLIKTLHKMYIKKRKPFFALEKEITSFMMLIAERALASNGNLNIFWELLNNLSYHPEKQPSDVERGLRSIQANLLYNILQKLKLRHLESVDYTKIKSVILPDTSLSLAEVKLRFELLVDRAVQFIIYSKPSYQFTLYEIKLLELLVILGIEGNSHCSCLTEWGLSLFRPKVVKSIVVTNLWDACRKGNLPLILCDGKIVKTLLWYYSLEESENRTGQYSEILRKLCETIGITQNEIWNVEYASDRIESNRENCIKELKSIIQKSVFKYETIAQACIESSMVITRTVAELQNSERRLFFSQMRQFDESYVFYEWSEVINRMTHEGAPWFNDTNFPKSWELDTTEGPSRIRVRFKRCTINIDAKFLLPDIEEKDTTSVIPYRPLNYLMSMLDEQINVSLNSQVLYNFSAKYLPVDGEINGELIMTKNKLVFVATHRYKFYYVTCQIERITEIWMRRYQHKDNALEIFMDSKKSHFFVFENIEDRNIVRDIFVIKVISNPEQSKLNILTQQWKEGQLTNWEYLMSLNQISGRTYNDLMQYPIFPWILSDYKSDSLDLTNEKSFRKLEKPIAIQEEENEQHYINNYNYINCAMTSLGEMQLKPYHYSSHYSNSGTVLHYLVRIPPFTHYFLRYQDNNFDIPDRTFHSVNTAWQLASRDSPTDVKELIPEFFCLPEMFENSQGFNFGMRQSGDIVSDVLLPKWCFNNPRTFVLIHRQALESEIVRRNLHNWIDLIFGYKQSGTAAVEAINVFHPATYAGFTPVLLSDPIERTAFETMVRTYGQMPRQLFKSQHLRANELSYNPNQPKVLRSVNGLRWGIFTGSPQLSSATILHTYKNIDIPFSYLIPFYNTNVFYGIPEKCSIMRGSEEDIYNMISWNHEDNIVRIRPLSELNVEPKPLLLNRSLDEITACGSDFNASDLWLGHKSGRITIFKCSKHFLKKQKKRQSHLGMKLSYNSAFWKFSSKNLQKSDDNFTLHNFRASNYEFENMSWTGPIVLIRHTDEITQICLSTEFKITVTVARDGLAVIWDGNTFNYIRTIEKSFGIHTMPISLVNISSTLGDILTVYSIEHQSQSNKLNKQTEEECFEVTEETINDFVNISVNLNSKSMMRLHSVNARYINHVVLDEKVLCASYSYVKEGVGVNVIASGFEGGIVRLWSSWDLTLVKELIIGNSDVKSVIYSTHQHLITLTKDNTIHVWESKGLLGNAPKFPQILHNKTSKR